MLTILLTGCAMSFQEVTPRYSSEDALYIIDVACKDSYTDFAISPVEIIHDDQSDKCIVLAALTLPDYTPRDFLIKISCNYDKQTKEISNVEVTDYDYT